MVPEEKIKAVAEAFATSLDRNDFGAVMSLITPSCRSDLSNAAFTPKRFLMGPSAIVESYRWHDARTRAAFDHVEYSSCVEHIQGSRATIRFTDVLEKNHVTHTYQCRQHITIDESGTIRLIVHEDIPAERVAVREFMNRVGVQL